MEYLLYAVFLFSCLLGVCYVFVVAAFAVGWIKTPVFKESGVMPHRTVSVVVPARDEEDNIRNSLTDILSQNYPKQLYEIIFVDDNSTDSTLQIVEEVKAEHPDTSIRIIRLKEEKGFIAYKKRAIDEAVKIATGELIFSTDADCRMNKQWMASIVDYFERNNSEMIIAPVCFYGNDAFFGKLQILEFLSLIGVSGGAAYFNKAMMCNGANLVYKKTTYFGVGGYKKYYDSCSGDDVFLMHEVKKNHSNRIGYIKSLDATVFTKPEETIRGFYFQKKRWASKARKYSDVTTFAIAVIILTFNFAVLADFVAGIFNRQLLLLSIVLIIVKAITDFIFLYHVTSFFKRRDLLWIFIPAELLYYFYVSFIGIIANFGKINWKGRIF